MSMDNSNQRSNSSGLLAAAAVLAGFFVMGFVDVVGTATAYVKTECGLSDKVASFLPSMIFIWFFLLSLPSGILAGRIGRKNTVVVSLLVTIVAMFLPLFAGPSRAAIYFISFAFLGIGNTILQAALPSLLSNIVPPDQLTSRISLGQFIKALCAAISPLIAGLAAQRLGNWKLIFPIYGGLTVLSAVWLLVTPVKREPPAAQATTFGSCLALLKDPFILAMFTGILFSVGADVGFNFSIPPYLKDFCKLDEDHANMAPTVYFVAKTVGSFLGAMIFARYSAAKCFPASVLLSLAATVGMLYTHSATGVLACIFLASLGLSNTFGMAFGLAMKRLPTKANEISGLMVMAIAGGAIIPPIMGTVQSARGPKGLVYVLIVCLLYLLVLGFFARNADSEKAAD